MNETYRALLGELTSPRTMMAAEERLLNAGPDALRILESIFSGEAINEHGVAYRQLGLPLRCALEIVARLGSLAKPLEPYIREEVKRGVYWVAASALRQMAPLEEESIAALAVALSGDFDLAAEAARTLIALGHSEHPTVHREVEKSPQAAKAMAYGKWAGLEPFSR